MSELRQDPITRDWVIINPERAKRPHNGAGSAVRCPFCAGNEALTPAATDVIEEPAGTWSVRAVPNAFPALLPGQGTSPAERSSPEGWRSLPGVGQHEVIVESRDHGATLASLSVTQVRRVLEMYLRRFRALAAADGAMRQVVLFRNQGVRAGTSLSHPHSQIVATPVVSPETRARVAGEIAYYDANGQCGLCTVLQRELASGVRLIHRSERFATLAPFASRVPFHVQVIPLEHRPAFAEVEPAELDDLAGHLHTVLGALSAQLVELHYNLVVVTPPNDQVHQHANHWFIDVLPRLTTPAGFELGSRIVVNPQTPELAAEALSARI